MKSNFCLILINISLSCLMLTQRLVAQSPSGNLILKGMLTDSISHSQLTFATIKLNDIKGEAIEAGVSHGDGSFGFTGLTAATYQVSIVTTGYEKKKSTSTYRPTQTWV